MTDKKVLAGGKLTGGNPEHGRVENDYYATNPKAVEMLLTNYAFDATTILEPKIKKGDQLYFSRILPNVGIYEVCDVKVRTVANSWFSVTEKRTHKTFLFSYADINKTIFYNREEAVWIVKEQEKNKKIISDEKYYEEY